MDISGPRSIPGGMFRVGYVQRGEYVQGEGGYVQWVHGTRGWVPTPCYSHLVAATTCTVSMWPVRILLECFLALWIDFVLIGWKEMIWFYLFGKQHLRFFNLLEMSIVSSKLYEKFKMENV